MKVGIHGNDVVKFLGIYNKALMLLFCVLGLTGCFPESWAWNQKLTIVVETPAGIKTGSSVTAVKRTRNEVFKDGGPFWTEVVGEATFLELGEGRYLFATIGSSGSPISMASEAVGMNTNRGNSMDRIEEALEAASKPLPIPPEHYPLLVTFDDIKDPASVKQVTPENFSEIFGAGYGLKEITVEMTEQTVTSNKISKILPCLDSRKLCAGSVDVVINQKSRNVYIQNGFFRRSAK